MGLFVRKQTTGIEQPLYQIGLQKQLLIVGLGNIGSEYDGTRHNVGFFCIDAFTSNQDFPAWSLKKDLHCQLTSLNMGDTKVIAIKPTTYMNESGLAVQAVQHFFKISAEQTIIVYDELDVPFGSIRTRSGGGSGGHNGIKSIISHGGEACQRLRIGIGNQHAASSDSADFVLAKFSKAEEAAMPILAREVTALLTEAIFSGQLPRDTRHFTLP